MGDEEESGSYPFHLRGGRVANADHVLPLWPRGGGEEEFRKIKSCRTP